MKTLKPIFHALLIPLLGGLIVFGVWSFLPLNAQQEDCAIGQPLDQSFAVGSSWDLCWSHSAAEGILLHQLHYTTPDGLRRQVMKEASIAQIILSPDDGSTPRHLLSTNTAEATGLGNDNLLSISQEECADGQLLSYEDRNVLCQQVLQRGYIYRYFNLQRQGEYLSLLSVSHLEQGDLVDDSALDGDSTENGDEQLFIIEWRLYDDGTIEPAVGDAGILAPNASPYVTDVIWRLDLDIGQNGDDDVAEEFEIEDSADSTQHSIVIGAILTETARLVSPDRLRSWRMRAGTLTNPDGHLVSYQLEARTAGHHYLGNENEPWSQHQFYVTALNPCERLATQNGPNSDCSSDVSQFVNGESLVGQDLVFWYRASMHRLERDEDALAENVAWLSFHLVPRDWTSVNPLTE